MIQNETKNQSVNQFERAKALPKRMITVKIRGQTWDSLTLLKGANETFDDVINSLLMKRTQSIGNDNIKAIKYQRKTTFFVSPIKSCIGYDLSAAPDTELGFEIEYNDFKNNKTDFVLDLKIKKIFFGKKILNPSEFFGVDNEHKHFSKLFLAYYLVAVAFILAREFRGFIFFNLYGATYSDENIVRWRNAYFEYNLSEESFKSDIEEPLRLSEDEKPSREWIKRVEGAKIMQLYTKIDIKKKIADLTY